MNPNRSMPDEISKATRLEPPGDKTTLTAAAGVVQAQLTARPGDRFGRYKILEEIGQGGCGVVFVAEQEEPVRRRVALKVIKLGMDTRQVIARFEAERQALAMMDHPNIARVLDAGATDTGRPFFVMELVRGIKITDYCDQKKLSTSERLKLFIQVCQAVQHAHQKGIIHRDLKPSNILVTVQDGVPTPKVIDFGIAKATADQKLTDKTIYTAFEQFIGTPAYMSPEQAEMSGVDVDTRSDIYSLGVLLYELLVGETPFSSEELLGVGLDAMRRILREKDPARPSTKLSTMTQADLTAIALHRQSEPPKLIHLVRGDLDWIVMKALEKDRTRRYETANGFATDIQRHLKNEPVTARPPGEFYRLRKLIRRNKLAFAAAGLIAVVLVAATGISAWQAVRATRAETLARARLADSEAVSKFLTEVFQSPDPDHDGRTITMAESLDAAEKKLETDLATQPATRIKLEATLGSTYYGLGQYPEAVVLQEKVRDYYLANLGLENSNTLIAMHRLGFFYDDVGRYDDSLKLAEQALPLAQKVFGPEDPNTLDSMYALAICYERDARYDDAIKLMEQVLPLSRKVNGPESRSTWTYMHWLAVLYEQAGHDEEPGRADDSVKLMEQVLALGRKLNGPESPRTLNSMESLADCYADDGRNDDAIKLIDQALPLSRKVYGPEHPLTIHVMESQANDYDLAGRHDEALKLFEQVLALDRKVLGPEHPETHHNMRNLAIFYDDAGRHDEALKLREQMLPLRKKALGPEHPNTLDSMNHLADSYDGAGRHDDALKLRDEVLSLGSRSTNAMVMDRAAYAYYALGRNEEAIALLQQSRNLNPTANMFFVLELATWQAWYGQEAAYEDTRHWMIQQAEGADQDKMANQAAKAACIRPSTDAVLMKKALMLAQRAVEVGKGGEQAPWCQLALGMAEYRNGQYAAAEQPLSIAEQTAGNISVLDGFHPRQIQGAALLYQAMSLFKQGRQDEARRLFTQAQAQMPPLPKDDSKPVVDGEPADLNDLICWLAYKEARALMEGLSASVAAPSGPK